FSFVTRCIVIGSPSTFLILRANSSALLLSESKQMNANFCTGKLLIPKAIPSCPSDPKVAI
ncbi:MAG: hypothetical protein WAU25_11395, partial [Nitrososphaeraceae archaeon]